ncbi:hypothetical protein [Massilia sp. CF038]|uniref:hypothetical protein n=1 Tax=Massilia sp. CF038 TaxID=1881045 RepID=UPI0009102A93|nr:hypothetical protein [Massilia sp. CF038]SHH67194.1 hypothetical protein SAMN05428948_4871 [Massilia sp. CF038]
MKISEADIAAFAERTGVARTDVLRIAVEEAFLRRAAVVNGPFMLKGSYVTRQQLAEGWRRMPGDLDWVGLGPLDALALTQWVTAVTETELDDGVRFRSFSENAFWRSIDYAMDDDFPTVNTDLVAWVGEQLHEINGMDVSFGLTLQPPPRPLAYQPAFGPSFVLPSSCALELQLAWKLHQCLVRPRFKDMLDLMLVLRENEVQSVLIWNAMEDECRDGTPIARFNWLLDCTIGQHPHWRSIGRGAHSAAEYFWIWRNSPKGKGDNYHAELVLSDIFIDSGNVPSTFDGFLAELAALLKRAGFLTVRA